MSYSKAVRIYIETLSKVILIKNLNSKVFHKKQYRRKYPNRIDFPSKGLSYKKSKNIWVLKNSNGMLGIVDTEKETLRPHFSRPVFNKYRITCKLKRKSILSSQSIIETPPNK